LTYFSGVVDENDHVRTGGYPGAFRELLGLVIEEFAPLLEEQRVRLSDGGTGSIWTDRGRATTAEVLATYDDGPSPGSPALTRNAFGAGACYYVGTELDDPGFDRTIDRVLSSAGVATSGLPAGVEVVRRTSPDAAYVFVINHTADEALLAASGHELLADEKVDGELRVAPGGCAVVRETRAER
jgi:beta-galactosidase